MLNVNQNDINNYNNKGKNNATTTNDDNNNIDNNNRVERVERVPHHTQLVHLAGRCLDRTAKRILFSTDHLHYQLD